ncbi:glycosyltransferase [Diaporthe helianthi]|uniref:Glycosyltransferase n=1 Tax=Diaporthe helianthi TaxID=158607 RepID=A0A2P5I6I7_DIAHE|nr:glycosyltransferase [Diaporthe helianthi]
MILKEDTRRPDGGLPYILYAPAPPEGHMKPAIQICTYLVEHGFDVTLMGSPRWKQTVEMAGMNYSSLAGLVKDSDAVAVPNIPTSVMTMPLAPLLGEDFARRFAKLMVQSWDVLRFALVGMAHRLGLETLRCRGIVILSDTAFSGVLPLKLGAYMPPGFGQVRIKTVGIGVVPRFWATPYHPPWGLGLAYDASDMGIARTLRAHDEQKTLSKQRGGEDKVLTMLEIYGCNVNIDSLFHGYETFRSGDGTAAISHSFLDAITVCHDTTLQMSTESLEFLLPPGDKQKYVPPHLKHAGFLPRKSIPSDLSYPSWFHELTKPGQHDPSSTPTKVVLVAQGTQTNRYDEVVMPTIQALAGEPGVMVIALLCHRGAKLDHSSFQDGILPPNVRVLDYFPYDAILPYVDVFVSSSGFGGLSHAIANSVPMVQCGWIVDKPDIGRRVEYSGLGVYIGREDYPARPEVIKSAVRTILDNEDSYKRRAEELHVESETDYQPLECIKEEIMALHRDSWKDL